MADELPPVVEDPENGYLRDETGGKSTARLAFWIILPFTLVLITLDSIRSLKFDVPGPAYVLLATVFTFICVWAGGARMMQYVGPQLGAILSGIAQGVRGYGTATTHFDDDVK